MEENKNLNNQPENEEEKKKKKCGFLVWWHKLSKGAKIGISAAAGVVLTSAIVFPTLAATVWNKKDEGNMVWNDSEGAYTCKAFSAQKDKEVKFTVDITHTGFTQPVQFGPFDGTTKLTMSKTDETKDLFLKSITKNGTNLSDDEYMFTDILIKLITYPKVNEKYIFTFKVTKSNGINQLSAKFGNF